MAANSFYPVVAGRVSDPLQRTRGLSQLQYDQIVAQRLQTQLSTGQRFTRPSEDPNAAIRAMSAQRLQEDHTQRQVNLKTSNSYLTVAESTLAEAGDVLNDVKGLAIQAASTTLSAVERDTMVVQIDDQISQLMNIANRTYNDRYLFAGGAVRTRPYEYSAQGVLYRGNNQPLETIVSDGLRLAHSVDGQAVFGGLAEDLIGEVDLNPAVTAETELSQLNEGSGVQAGAIQFSSGTDVVLVDLADTARVGDVLDRINATSVDGRPLSATIAGGRLRIDYADALGGTLRIGNVGAGQTADELGVRTTVASPPLPIDGEDLNPRLGPHTPLTALTGGAGFDISGGLRIRQGGQTFDVDFAGAETVEDLLIKLNTSGASIRAGISPDGRSIQVASSKSGVDLSIGEVSGDLARRLGLRTFHEGLPLSELNRGQGIFAGDGADLEFTRNDGTILAVDLAGAVTVDDALALINNHPDNQDPTTQIVASIDPVDNAIRLSSPVSALPGAVPVSVRNAGGSQAATGLRLIPAGATQAVATEVAGVHVLVGGDPHPRETDGVFNTLVRLREAIRVSDFGELGRMTEQLDLDIDRVASTRGQIGVRQRRADALLAASEDQSIILADDLSQLLDTDFAAAIAELNAQQVTYQASLQLLAQLHRTSLFNLL